MKLTALLMLMVLLSGCSWFVKEPEVKYITKTEYVTIELTDTLRATCKTTPPVDIPIYMAYTPEEREAYLVDYSIALMGDNRNCDQLRGKIVEVIDSTNKLYKEESHAGD